MQRRLLLVFTLLGLGTASPAAAQDPPPAPPEKPKPAPDSAAAALVPSRWIGVPAPDKRARRPLRPDAVFAAHLLDRSSPPPHAGNAFLGETGKLVQWTDLLPDADGTLDGDRFGWAYAAIESSEDAIVLADLDNCATLWVNGDPFVGDAFGYGFGGVPVGLRKGKNHLFLTGPRGRVKLSLLPVKPGVRVEPWDETTPDSAPGLGPGPAAAETLTNPSLEFATSQPESVRPGPRLAPLWIGKYRCDKLRISSHPTPPYRHTFISSIDGSVQEFALLPPSSVKENAGPASIVLSLHGAGVDELKQAASYSARPDFWIVAPTNRRPYGFDWQDWGRRDAYEALDAALRITHVDPRRVYLTGHSMGGHGTWHLAANDPDRFAAIAPSAGWASFDTLSSGPRPRTERSSLWFGSDGGSDTLALIGNIAQTPAFVVHGTKDDNVPLAQSEQMLDALRKAGAEPRKHFQEGGGHWWDGDLAVGADCVDLPAIFDHFRNHPPAAAPAQFTWTTVDPSIDADHHWLHVEQPRVYGKPIAFRAAWDAASGRATVETDNAAWIRVSAPVAGALKQVLLDGRMLPANGDATWFSATAQGWAEAAGPPPVAQKSAADSGPFKRAFDRRFVFVVPTQGSDEETREAWSRVRFDAQQWWYRANAGVDVVIDSDYAKQREALAGRNVILYGNADTNAAWKTALGDACPIELRRGAVAVGTRTWKGDNIAAFFVRARADDPEALVGVMGDTGARGARIGHLHMAFASGVGYPDFTVWDERVVAMGDGAVLAAGWFDARWAVQADAYLAPLEPATPR